MREITAQLDHANQHGAGLLVPLPPKATARRLRVGIVRTAWHSELIDLLEGNCIKALLAGGVERQNVLRTRVSGSFELPYVCQRMIENHSVDCVIAIGILLKGGTIHMEVIAHAMTKSLLDVQLKTSTPVIFGVLTVFSVDQARERAESDLGFSWGQAALSQAGWHLGRETTELFLEPLPDE
jgi:6,7-dimethyl-8-ribityllumazine synthase